MQAVQIALRMVAGVGDEVLIPSPAWPNFAAAAGISGAKTVFVPQSFGNRGWTLDMGDLEAAITPRTRAIVINSPSNPSGWTASRAELEQILAIARRTASGSSRTRSTAASSTKATAPPPSTT